MQRPGRELFTARHRLHHPRQHRGQVTLHRLARDVGHLPLRQSFAQHARDGDDEFLRQPEIARGGAAMIGVGFLQPTEAVFHVEDCAPGAAGERLLAGLAEAEIVLGGFALGRGEHGPVGQIDGQARETRLFLRAPTRSGFIDLD